MKTKYFVLIAFLATLAVPGSGQEIPRSAYLIKGLVPKAKEGVRRFEGNITQAYLNYMQSDSAYYPLSYFTDYMFYMNSRYAIKDTTKDTVMENELLLQSFSVMFDTIVDASLDTGYASDIVKDITIDSLNIILGQSNNSGTQDTIVVQIDSVDTLAGYITPAVLYSDTVFTGIKGMSDSNNWLSPFNLVIRPDFMLSTNRFAVTVKYFGSKFDTLGFLPGFGDTNCTLGGSGPIPRGTHIGSAFGSLTANSLTSGYQYFFGTPQTIPTVAGSTNGLFVRCSKPSSKYWYFQDNPISAYISFTNTTGIDEINRRGFRVSQNYPNPFNESTEITYNLTKASDVQFCVNDLTGRTLMETSHKQLAPGKHVINLNASRFSPGIYIYTFNINGSKVSRKMVITQ